MTAPVVTAVAVENTGGSFTPAAGLAGATVAITGTSLSSPTAVKFGTVAATSFGALSSTLVLTVAPPGVNPGVVDVTVTTSGGTSATSPVDQFTYIGPHCRPLGSLGPNEIPVSPINASNTWASSAPGVNVGHRRGVVVMMGGLPLGAPPTPTPPGPPLDSAPPDNAFSTATGTLTNLLVADGWVVLSVPYNESVFHPYPVQAIYNDITDATGGHGSRYLAEQLRLWDHVRGFIHMTYGSLPIVPFGVSWGGYHAIQIAANKQADILGYVSHCPATILSNANPAFEGTVDFSSVNTTGLDAGQTLLNGVMKPGLVSYGRQDEAVGWAYASEGSVSGFTYTGINNNVDQMIINAKAAGAQVTRNHTNDFHQLSFTTVGTSSLVSGPLSSLTTLVVPDSTGLVSGGCSILADDGQWHSFTFTGNDTTTGTLTGCVFQNPGSASAFFGAMVGNSGSGAVPANPISGTPTPMSIMYFVSTVLDPLAPAVH